MTNQWQQWRGCRHGVSMNNRRNERKQKYLHNIISVSETSLAAWRQYGVMKSWRSESGVKEENNGEMAGGVASRLSISSYRRHQLALARRACQMAKMSA
jgi:hypothetical protein